VKLIDRLTKSLRSTTLAPDGSLSPVAVIWTDTDGQWFPLIATLRTVLPSLFVLGQYDRATRTGPAIWLKCVVDRAVPEAPPLEEIPVLYLPRVSRQELRAAGDCPPSLQPLIELQYRGRVWHQSNGHDWTVRAFLVSEDGLGLDVAADRRTEEAFLRVLPLLAEVDVSQLKGRRLDADDFDKLSIQDPVRDLLLWLNSPEAFEAGAKGNRWESFCGVCQSEFGVNPDKIPAGEIAAFLLRADLRFERVWNRFVEAPQLYPGVAKLLHAPAVIGQGSLTLDPSRDPRINEREEGELRRDLGAAATLPQAAACQRVLELEGRHSARRDWVWARMDLSPWAMALKPLARLAKRAQNPISGWQCDRSAMEALAFFRTSADVAVMEKIVRTMYESWLDSSARQFQALVGSKPKEAQDAIGRVITEKDTCLLFVDGLRFDIAGWLTASLEARSLSVSMSHRLAPLPTVTPTAKLLASPIVDGIRGEDGIDFTPQIQTKSGWKAVNATLLRERLESMGVEVLAPDEVRIPSGNNNGGWTECGSIDSLGHSLQKELVHQLDSEVHRIADRIVSLLDAGWYRVRVVTDHGWLLLPGGLPKVDLPAHLVETKWARCAVVKGHSEVTVPVSSWHWNPDVRVASPPSIACFRAGEAYAHGGISPQECVVPELVVERGLSAIYATIQAVEWRGMRCRVRVDTNDPRVRVDLRTNWKQESTSIIASAKEVGANREVSLAVLDDAHEGAAASVVVLDPDGKLLGSQTTRVGERS
jgi:hypothetical protein